MDFRAFWFVWICFILFRSQNLSTKTNRHLLKMRIKGNQILCCVTRHVLGSYRCFSSIWWLFVHVNDLVLSTGLSPSSQLHEIHNDFCFVFLCITVDLPLHRISFANTWLTLKIQSGSRSCADTLWTIPRWCPMWMHGIDTVDFQPASCHKQCTFRSMFFVANALRSHEKNPDAKRTNNRLHGR